MTLTLAIWPRVKVMIWLHYQDQTWQWGVMVRTPFFGICALWSWPWRYDLGTRSWHTIGSWTISVRYYPDLTWQWGVMARTQIFSICAQCDLDLEDMTLGQGHDTPFRYRQQLREILSRSNLAVRRYAWTQFWGICAVWPWPWRYDLGSRSWHNIGSWTTIV